MTTWTRLRLAPALFNRGESAVPYRRQPRRDSSTVAGSFPVSLLMLAGGLRLINGVHATAVVQGFINHPMGALSYGTIAFTGPGTLAATFALRGSLGARMRLVIGLYLGIILPGALLTLVLLPAIQAILLPESAVFSAIMVGGLALQAFGFDPARIASPVHPGQDRFASIRLLASPQAVLSIYLGASLLNTIVTHTYLHIRLSIPSVSQIVGTLLAVGSGMSITVAIGGVLAHRFRESLQLYLGVSGRRPSPALPGTGNTWCPDSLRRRTCLARLRHCRGHVAESQGAYAERDGARGRHAYRHRAAPSPARAARRRARLPRLAPARAPPRPSPPQAAPITSAPPGTATTTTNCTSATNTTCTLRGAISVATSGSDTIMFNSSGSGSTITSRAPRR